MKTLPENFCIAPFLQCTTHPTTSFSPCPYLGGSTWKASGNTILEQWRSKELEDLRESFINNKRNEICNRCWSEETHGKRSLRKRLLDPVSFTSDMFHIDTEVYRETLVDRINDKNYLQGPEILTIKNGNVCNAKCRVCHPNDSSKWIPDSAKLKLMLNKQYYVTDQHEKNWSDSQIEEILAIVPGLIRLELFGGEPMFNKKVIALLEKIVETNHAEHITLYINTNGSVNIVEKMPNIRHFKMIEIGVSIDGVGKHFDYIRHGLDYSEIKTNINLWKDYFQKHNVSYFIDCICTVEILNIFYLPEIKSAIKEFLPLSPYWNLLVDPTYLSIKNIPDHIKQVVISKLNSDPEEFADLISVMEQPCDIKEWEKFLEVTFALDSIRKEDFKSTFPEFASLMQI